MEKKKVAMHTDMLESREEGKERKGINVDKGKLM